MDSRTWCEHAGRQRREDGHQGDDADVGQLVVFAPLLGIIGVVLLEVDFLQRQYMLVMLSLVVLAALSPGAPQMLCFFRAICLMLPTRVGIAVFQVCRKAYMTLI